MRSEYTTLELLFANRWQWVRKRSKCLWVKDSLARRTYWVKFSDEELEDMCKRIGIPDWKPTFTGAVWEDWRKR